MINHKVLIIDYGVGNDQSIINALKFLGYDFIISNNKKDIVQAKVYILPGVGAFSEAMKNLNDLGITDLLKEQILQKKKPILGICLGFQVLADYSEENGTHQGLGFIKGGVIKFKAERGLRIPHVGWSEIKVVKPNPLFTKLGTRPAFYFDHSYHLVGEEADVSARCFYGADFTAAVQKDNIFGVQFHPEKSQNNGLKLFRSFFNYVGNI
ncbi:MAG: imidazole glycerol phosphate synthase subunit HisH [Patescibacteria group bacterium]|nr:imidazole glycerol phosphate synthase subunit HisH [Patescibacteria group bacterium]